VLLHVSWVEVEDVAANTDDTAGKEGEEDEA
jgi:hypothetical protein